MDKAELPDPWDAVRQHWPLVLPLAVLVYLLFAGYTPIFAGTMGLALTVVLILGMPLAALIGPLAFRLAFWVALGLAAAAFLRYGVDLARAGDRRRWSPPARSSGAGARRCASASSRWRRGRRTRCRSASPAPSSASSSAR